jgi:hypothetical protein
MRVYKPLMVPFSIQEMWESSTPDMDKLVEDRRNDSVGVNLEVKTVLGGHP